MEGAGFRSLIIFLLLAILAFVAGSLASENAVGALAPTALILGLFFLIYLGKNCWVLVFIVPPVLSVVELPFLKGFPLAYVICGIVLFYMLILYMMGYVKIKWNGVLLVDIATLIFCLYFVSTYIRHPVTIKALTSITDYGDADVGGKEYVFLVACMLSYLSLSIVSVKFDALLKTLKWAFWLATVPLFFMTVRGLVTGSVTMGDEVSSTRFGAFSGIGSYVINYVFAKYTLIGIVLSPAKIFILLISIVGILLSGFRSMLIAVAFYSFFMTCIYRQLCVYVLMGLAVWGGLVYISHEDEDLINELPFGIQRSMAVIPGVEVSKKAKKDAQGSSDWRLEMWKWALDPSTGYIKDYVWGDGYGLSLYQERLRNTAISLNLIRSGDNKLFAARGVWHNGAIHLIHRIGYVGLAIVYVWALIVVVFAYRVCCCMRTIEGREYVYVLLVPFFSYLITVWFLPCDSLSFITGLYNLALCKLVYLGIKNEYPMLIKGYKIKYTPKIFCDLRPPLQ